MIYRIFALPIALLVAVSGAGYAAEQETVFEWTSRDIEICRRSSSVGPAEGGGLSLIDRDLIRYESGATVHAVNRAAASEAVTGTTWIRKEFVLDRADSCGAILNVNHSGDARGLEILWNGDPLPFEVVHTRARGHSGVYPPDNFPEGHQMHHLNGQPYKSWWRGGWQEIEIPADRLKGGVNTAIIRGKPGASPVRFWIEQSLYPNRSAVSRDGGRTWDSERLSDPQNLNGEYVVRLMLRRHPASGWIESEPVDMWPAVAGTPVRAPARIETLALSSDSSPTGWRAPPPLRLQARLGSTPVYDPSTWTPWIDMPARGRGPNWPQPPDDRPFRYAQWRAELTPSADRLNVRVLQGLTLTATTRPLDPAAAPRLVEAKIEQPPIVRSSHVFAHARKTERLDLLREQAELDQVVEGHEPGLPQLLRIAQWIRSLKAGNNEGGQLSYMPSWDGLLFWNFARPGRIGRMCTTRAAFFVQCATALGYPARPMIWSHAIAEAWVDDLGQWVAFDPSGGFYFEVNGKPASMLEVALARHQEDRQVRRVWSDERKSGVQPDRNLAWYGRFFVPMRSNFLESDEPREPAHGSYSFKYDGHLRWLHPEREPLPWFRFTTSRNEDIAFTCNTVNLHLAAEKPNRIAVTVEHDMPNLERFEARRGNGEWEPFEASFSWDVKSGENRLEVRGVNAFGRAGRSARAVVAIQ